ncbi:MAG: RNA-binding S4 domain-containing protein [Acetobacteraceae bacterium]
MKRPLPEQHCPEQQCPEQQRLDAWLWCARIMKSRSRAADLVREGRVRINRQATDKPHARLRPGDILTLPLGPVVRVLAVRALAPRRGPAAAACLLYDEVPETQALLRGNDGDGIGRAPGTGIQA